MKLFNVYFDLRIPMEKLQTGDSVVIIAWKDKGTKSTIQSINGDRIVVKGVNIQRKWVKGEWLVKKEWAVHRSNIALWDANAEAPSKVSIQKDGGSNTRVYKKSGKPVK